MRGFLAPSVTRKPSEAQIEFAKLTRHRRTKLAKAAHTTLVKADQWARGDAVSTDVATALEHGLKALHEKHGKKAPKKQ